MSKINNHDNETNHNYKRDNHVFELNSLSDAEREKETSSHNKVDHISHQDITLNHMQQKTRRFIVKLITTA